jgi:hypothetical protein
LTPADAVYCAYCNALLDPPNERPIAGLIPRHLVRPLAAGLGALIILCLAAGVLAAAWSISNRRATTAATPSRVIVLSATIFSGTPSGSSPPTVAVTPSVEPAATETAIVLAPTATLAAAGPTSSPTADAGQAGMVTSLTLIDADSDRPITGFGSIPEGAIIDLGALPTANLNIIANVGGGVVESVRFELDGNPTYIVENEPPYALAGDLTGDYQPWNPVPGVHTVTAVPYAANLAQGEAGVPLSVTFTVIGP